VLLVYDRLERDRRGGARRPLARRRLWRAFGDPQLDALVAEALDHAPRLAVAAARIREAQALASSARAGLFPSVDASAAAMRVHPSDYQLPTATEWQNEIKVGLSYELDLWGRSGVEVGLHRLAEVFLGSAMALAVAFAFAKTWPLPPDSEAVRAKR
jgi:hypothetical protein